MESSRSPHSSSSLQIPPPAISGENRGRTQNVADALLNAKAPTRTRLPSASSNGNAAKSLSATNTGKLVNPYSQPRILSRGLNSSRGLSSKKSSSLPSKHNDVSQDVTRKRNASTKLHIDRSSKSASNASAFQRRNARDSNSKDQIPPPTTTDLNLLTLLDGPRKKSGSATNRPGLQKSTTLPPQKKSPIQKLQQQNKNSIDPVNISKRKIDGTAITAKRQKGPNGSLGGVVLSPPPPPSYSVQTNATKRIRGVSSIHGKSRSCHSTEPMYIDRPLSQEVKPRKRVSSHTIHLAANSEKSKPQHSNSKALRTASPTDEIVEATNICQSLEHCQERELGIDVQRKSKNEEEGCNCSISHEMNDNVPKESRQNSPNQAVMSSGYAASNPYKKKHCLDRDDFASVTGQLRNLIDNEETVAGGDVENNICSEKRSDVTIIPNNVKYLLSDEKQICSTSQRCLLSGHSFSEPDSNIRDQPEKGGNSADLGTSTTIGDTLHSKSNIGTSSASQKRSSERNESSPNCLILQEICKERESKYAEWYDPEEHAEMEKQTTNPSDSKDTSNGRVSKTKGNRNQNRKTTIGINDNFVRLDLRNSAGSCRGARNLKKLNKQKHWRARHRFGMNDPGAEDGSDENKSSDEVEQIHPNQKCSSRAEDGGDLKYFASVKNAGVDPLDDYIDGVFSSGNNSKDINTFTKEKATENIVNKSLVPKRDESVPLCTRHQRPCKLHTVKKKAKGNKGRKFFVCSMPKGEQCDFFKWEEDTIEVSD